jgi:hypothetical protein
VATFRPIPQSVGGVGVRFSIGDRIRDLGEKSFCLTRRERKFFILLRCFNHFLSLFSRNWESDLSLETLWRSCGAIFEFLSKRTQRSTSNDEDTEYPSTAVIVPHDFFMPSDESFCSSDELVLQYNHDSQQPCQFLDVTHILWP